jgi:UDP-glucose:(glucosyl)LPS alpha-1,2-glucosyltransferase
VVIVVRKWEGVFCCPIKYKKIFYWTGQAANNPKLLGIGDKRIIQAMDGLLLKSHWHAEETCKAAQFPAEKVWVLPNGVNLTNFEGEEKRHFKRLIYASLPYRGLKKLLPIYQALKPKHPELELRIFSSFDRSKLEDSSQEDKKYREIFEQLKRLPGCFLSKSIPQHELAREFMQAAIWAYPTKFQETSYGLALEAQAGGCVPVTSDLAALKEGVGEAGVLIPPPMDDVYFKRYVEAIDHLFENPSEWSRLSLMGMQKSKKCSWEERAKAFLIYLNDRHGIY